MVPPVNVLAVATAVPPHELDQRAVADAARQVYARTFARYPKLADVFVNAGIERRYSACPLEWLSAPHDLGERTEVYLEGASDLFIRSGARGARPCGHVCARRRCRRDGFLDRNRHARVSKRAWARRWDFGRRLCACQCSAAAVPAVCRAWRSAPAGARRAGRGRSGGRCRAMHAHLSHAIAAPRPT